ncbi:hypothetical protein Pcinc_006480 [Petrolisthes cinctipes]|uniref:Transposase Tc1-like domain-containing protein n=1 Tax=Petrolisthes cinctipes TaxID=88211 RepID=A0AAE1KZ45_PETCI|nr:hypothetical protein Pcinc_006480 [Petrolisthes cinctipes]
MDLLKVLWGGTLCQAYLFMIHHAHLLSFADTHRRSWDYNANMNHHDQHISERSRIFVLHDEGLSNRAIAGRLGVSLPTVRKWIRRWQETGNLNDLAITTDLGLEVSNTTVRRRLHAAGLLHRVPAMKEHLTDVHRNTSYSLFIVRLAFAQEHVTKDIGFWERTVFSDEKTFSSSNHGRIHLWRRDSTRVILMQQWTGFGGRLLARLFNAGVC